jgi:hypothetical protein
MHLPDTDKRLARRAIDGLPSVVADDATSRCIYNRFFIHESQGGAGAVQTSSVKNVRALALLVRLNLAIRCHYHRQVVTPLLLSSHVVTNNATACR